MSSLGGFITGPIQVPEGTMSDSALARMIAAEEMNPNPTTFDAAKPKWEAKAWQQTPESKTAAALKQQERDYQFKMERMDRKRQQELAAEKRETERIKRELDYERISPKKILSPYVEVYTKPRYGDQYDRYLRWAIDQLPYDLAAARRRALIRNLEAFISNRLGDRLDSIELERRIRRFLTNELEEERPLSPSRPRRTKKRVSRRSRTKVSAKKRKSKFKRKSAKRKD